MFVRSGARSIIIFFLIGLAVPCQWAQATCTANDFVFEFPFCGGPNGDLKIATNTCSEPTVLFVRAAKWRPNSGNIDPDYAEFIFYLDANEETTFDLTGLRGRGPAGNTGYQITISENRGLPNSPNPVIAVVADECPSLGWSLGSQFSPQEDAAVRSALLAGNVVGTLGAPTERHCTFTFDTNLGDLDNRSTLTYRGIMHSKYICAQPRNWNQTVDNCCLPYNPNNDSTEDDDVRCDATSSQENTSIKNGFDVADFDGDKIMGPGEHIQRRELNFPFCCDAPVNPGVASIHCTGAAIFSVWDDNTSTFKKLSPPLWLGYATDIFPDPASGLSPSDVHIRCIDFATPPQSLEYPNQDFPIEADVGMFVDADHDGVDDVCGNP